MSSAKSRRAHLYHSLQLQLHGRAPCWICGQHMEPDEATLEHLKPHAQGGTLRYDNVVLTHSHCNNMRHNAKPLPVDPPTPTPTPTHRALSLQDVSPPVSAVTAHRSLPQHGAGIPDADDRNSGLGLR